MTESLVSIITGSVTGIFIGAVTGWFTVFIGRKQLQADVQKSLFDATSNTFLNSQRIISEKRIEAAEVLWQSVMTISRIPPGVLAIATVLTDSGYTKKRRISFYETVCESDLKQYSSDIQKSYESVENVSIYLDSDLQYCFFSYHSFMMRVASVLEQGIQDPEKGRWYLDEMIRGYVRNMLGQDTLAKLDRESPAKIVWLQTEIEWNILSSLKKFVLGEKIEEATFERAKALRIKIAKGQPDPGNST